MVKQVGVITLLLTLLAGALLLAGCPNTKAGDSTGTAEAVPPPSAAAAGAQTELASVTYSVEGMTCDHCVEGITQSVTMVPGVKQCKVDLAGKSALVDYDPKQVTDQMIIDRINGLGYTASLKHDGGKLNALAGESGCACGGSGECSGECGDPAKAGAAGASQVPADIPAGCMRTVLFVEGVSSPEQAAQLVKSINALAGVSGAYADIAGSRITLDYAADTAKLDAVKKAITDAGFKVLDTPPAKKAEEKTPSQT
jgi:copper ion binding protein